jgi:hypothetical protein
MVNILLSRGRRLFKQLSTCFTGDSDSRVLFCLVLWIYPFWHIRLSSSYGNILSMREESGYAKPPLTASQKAKVRAKAHRVLGTNTKKKKKKG